MIRRASFFISLLALAVGAFAAGEGALGESRRLYDFTPVSETNPVLAKVIEPAIEIPESEFRAYVASEALQRRVRPLSLAEKRDALNRLVDDHLLVAEGYAQKADQDRQVVELLKATESALVEELLLRRELTEKAKSHEEYEALSLALRQRLFDQAKVRVAPAAYEKLKAAAAHLNRVDHEDAKAEAAGKTTTGGDESDELPDGLSEQERALPLATGDGVTARLGDVLQAYAEVPVEDRGDLSRPEKLAEILRDVLADGLVVAEAYREGIQNSDIVKRKVQLNRNALVRQWVLVQAASKFSTSSDSGVGLKAWYEAHQKTLGSERGLSPVKAEPVDATTRAMPDQDRARVEKVEALRKDKDVRVDEKRLEQLDLVAPAIGMAPAPARS
jgi:hypothetical protein